MASVQTPKQDRIKRMLSPGTPSPGTVNPPEKKSKWPPENSMAPIHESESEANTDSMAPMEDSKSETNADHKSIHINKADTTEIVQCVMSLVKDELKDFINETVKTMAQSVADVISSRFNSQLEALEDKNKTLSSEVTSLKDQVDTLTTTCNKLLTAQDEAEQYSRRNCLRISGIPETDEESTNTIMLMIASECDVNLDPSDIDRSHRLGKPRSHSSVPENKKNTPRDIIVKFTSYRSRARVFQSKKKLDNNSAFPNTYINEDLTKTRSELLYKARKMKNNGRFKSAFSRDGRIFVLDNNDRRQLITSAKNLDSFRLYSEVTAES